MININLKECCYECLEADITCESTVLYSDSEPVVNETELKCEHERVCEKCRQATE